DLTGNVVDQTNAVLPGVTVTATNTATNAVRITTTDGQGRFTIPALPPGTYTVTCELTGFTTEKSEQVTLTLGEWRGGRVAGDRVRAQGGRHERRSQSQRAGAARRHSKHGRLERRVAGSDRLAADQRPKLHLLLGHHAGRHRRPDAAARCVGDVGADLC